MRALALIAGPVASLVAGLVASLALAAPAAAQDFGATTQMQLDALRLQQQLDQQRSVAQHNELMALDARLRAEQAARTLEAQRAPTALPRTPYSGPPAQIDTSRLPSIPDEALAESNRRVREISKNPR